MQVGHPKHKERLMNRIYLSALVTLGSLASSMALAQQPGAQIPSPYPQQIPYPNQNPYPGSINGRIVDVGMASYQTACEPARILSDHLNEAFRDFDRLTFAPLNDDYQEAKRAYIKRNNAVKDVDDEIKTLDRNIKNANDFIASSAAESRRRQQALDAATANQSRVETEAVALLAKADQEEASGNRFAAAMDRKLAAKKRDEAARTVSRAQAQLDAFTPQLEAFQAKLALYNTQRAEAVNEKTELSTRTPSLADLMTTQQDLAKKLENIKIIRSQAENDNIVAAHGYDVCMAYQVLQDQQIELSRLITYLRTYGAQGCSAVVAAVPAYGTPVGRINARNEALRLMCTNP